jgi:hypothetical protein
MLGSCAKDAPSKESSTSPAPAAHRTLSERLSESNGYKQDATGNWKPQTDRRSSFETQDKSQFASKSYQKSAYKTDDYAKTSWWGNKSYDRKSYTGKTDGSRFKEASKFQHQDAQEAARNTELSKPFETSDYATQAAGEMEKNPVKTTSNSIVDKRRKVFIQPRIINGEGDMPVNYQDAPGASSLSDDMHRFMKQEKTDPSHDEKNIKRTKLGRLIQKLFN